MSTETLLAGSRGTQRRILLFAGTTRAENVQPVDSQILEFLLQHFPDFLLADENDEDKDTGENVEHVEDVPDQVGAADCKRDDFHRPRHAHQDEQTEDDTDPTSDM
jgi:hypothetical protein